MASEVQKRALEHPGGLQKREASRQQWKRDLSDRANGTIDPYYQCAIYDEMVDYALNFSLPWSEFFLVSHRFVFLMSYRLERPYQWT